MTLSTDFVIRTPGAQPREVFVFCQRMLGNPDAQQSQETSGHWENPGYANEPDQGLNAWLMLWYGADGPLVKACYCTSGEPDYEDTPCPGGTCLNSDEPDGFIKVNWDTAYGYREGEEGCTELHRRFILALGAWCEARGLVWSWQNEYTGEWHDGRDGLVAFGAHGDQAMAWFDNEVAPAIAAGGLT